MSHIGLALAAPVGNNNNRIERSIRDGVIGAVGAGVGGFVISHGYGLYENGRSYFRNYYGYQALPNALVLAGTFAIAGLVGGLVNGSMEDKLGDWTRFALSVAVPSCLFGLGFGLNTKSVGPFFILGALGGALGFGANKLFS